MRRERLVNERLSDLLAAVCGSLLIYGR